MCFLFTGTQGKKELKKKNNGIICLISTGKNIRWKQMNMFLAANGKIPSGWKEKFPVFSGDEKMATRKASGKVLNAIADQIPFLMGGSADLSPSTDTILDEFESFSPEHRDGRNFHFGIREHSMGAILNGMALTKGFIPYGATFLIFSDYMRPPMRLAAISKIKPIYVFTHDSIGLGEDGTTHQPIEQLAGLRCSSQYDRDPSGRCQ